MAPTIVTVRAVRAVALELVFLPDQAMGSATRAVWIVTPASARAAASRRRTSASTIARWAGRTRPAIRSVAPALVNAVVAV